MLEHGTTADKISMFQRLNRETSGIVKSCISIAYFMRGSIQYDSVLMKCPIERDEMIEFIEERLEVEGKKMNPVY